MKNMKWVLSLAVLCGLVAASPLRAQDPAIIRPQGTGFIVDFENQQIRAVIMALAEAGGLNVQIPGNVTGTATLRLNSPVSREDIPEVIGSIVTSNGLLMDVSAGGLYTITRPAAAGRGAPAAATVSPTDVSVWVINLRHLNNVVLAQILTGVFNTTGRGFNPNTINAGRAGAANRAGGAGAAGARGGGAGGGAAGRGGGRGGGDDQFPDLSLSAPPQSQMMLDPAQALTAIYDPAEIARLLGARNDNRSVSEVAAEILAQGGAQGGQGRGGRGGGGQGGGQGGDIAAAAQQGIAALLGGLQGGAGAAQAQLTAAQLQAQQPVIVPTEGTNQIIVRATPADFALIQAIVATIDLRPLQVLIEVNIVEVRRSNDLNVGVSGGASSTKPGATTPRASATLARPTAFDNARDFAMLLTGGGGTVDFNLALNALTIRGDVTVKSVPLILAQNNRQAQLIVGEERPFVQTTQLVPNDNGVLNQVVQYRDVATSLYITPTINADGYVNMDVDQSVQDVTSEVQFDAPVISSRRAVTSLFVRSGQTAVIGGLSSNRSDKTRTGIPILSSIPIIGPIFGSTRNSEVETELYLFLTPHVILTDLDGDRLREAVRSQSDLLQDLPLRQIIDPGDVVRVVIPPDTAGITRIPARVPPDTGAANRAGGAGRTGGAAGRGGRGGGVDTLRLSSASAARTAAVGSALLKPVVNPNKAAAQR